MRHLTRLGLLSLIFMSLCACLSIKQGGPIIQDIESYEAEATTHMALTLTAWPISEDQITITHTPVTPTDEPCAYMWASHPAPDVDDYLASAIASNSLENISAHAEYYGEDCVTASGVVVSFGTMYTDLYFEAIVPRITDEEGLGVILGQITDLIAAIPDGVLAGSFNGYLAVHYVSTDGERNIWTELESVLEYRRQGLDGAALMNAIGD